MKCLRLMLLLLLTAAAPLAAQIAGEPAPTTGSGASDEPQSDSLFIFTPAGPLIDSVANPDSYRELLGMDILFSNSGFGVGAFYQRPLSQKLASFVNLGFTGSRNSDEFPEFIPDGNSSYTGRYDVPGKVNRVFTVPVTFGVNYRILDNVLVENFRPYVNAGAGPTFILALPYEYDFFASIGHMSAHVTAGGFVGLGAEFGVGRPTLGLNIRYYYIPYGPGVESLRDQPITQFGGLFLTLNVGFFR